MRLLASLLDSADSIGTWFYYVLSEVFVSSVVVIVTFFELKLLGYRLWVTSNEVVPVYCPEVKARRLDVPRSFGSSTDYWADTGVTVPEEITLVREEILLTLNMSFLGSFVLLYYALLIGESGNLLVAADLNRIFRCSKSFYLSTFCNCCLLTVYSSGSY